jgi:hypothetical protein
MDFRKSVPPSHVAAVLLAAALILWRMWESRLVGIATDWVVLISLYGIFSLFAPEGRVRTSGTIAAIAGLMLLYAWGQAPFILALVRPPS